MSVQVLQREQWFDDPKDLGDCFRLKKDSKAHRRSFDH